MRSILRVIIFLLIFLTVDCSALGNTLNDESVDVKVGDVIVPVISTDITWGSMDFVLSEETNYVWNHNTKMYELLPVEYVWSAENNFVEVKNKSTIKIEAEVEYQGLYNGIYGSFNESKKIIRPYQTDRFELNLSGEINSESNKLITAGRINLFIS